MLNLNERVKMLCDLKKIWLMASIVHLRLSASEIERVRLLAGI